MQTLGEMQTELTSRLMAASTSTLFPSARILLVLKDSYLWAGGLLPWTETAKGKKTSTAANQDYYDYPEGFYTDSIDSIYVDSDKYERKAFADFRDYVRDDPDSSKHYYADYGRQFWLYPTPTTDGTNNIEVWGHEQVTALSLTTDTTIFSLHDDSGNEAIVKKAFSVLIKRMNPQLSIQEENEAIKLLSVIYAKEKEHQQTQQRLDKPFFDVPDYFNGSTTSPEANFTRG